LTDKLPPNALNEKSITDIAKNFRKKFDSTCIISYT